MDIPTELVPKVRALLARKRTAEGAPIHRENFAKEQNLPFLLDEAIISCFGIPNRKQGHPMRRIISFALIVLSLSTTPLFAQRFRSRRVFTPPPFMTNVSFVSMLPNGQFVHRTEGTFVPGTRSFAPSAMGNARLTGQGVFMPVNGTFVPAGNGNFVLTLREAFNAKTKTFVPSPTGNFLLSSRGNLIASGTKAAVGSFLPFVPPVPTTSIVPATAISPFAANPYGFNAFATNPYVPVNPYATGAVNPYLATSYPMPYAASNNYASPVAGTPTANSYAPTAPALEGLGAYGLPTENRHIKWPLAFRVLPPEQKQNLLDTLETQLALAATQAASGSSNASNLSAATRSVARLGAWLTAHRTAMADATYRDGLDFVHTLDEALAALKR